MNNKPQLLHGVACGLLVAASLVGCAHSGVTHHSWQRDDAAAELDRFAYLDCVDSKVSARPTYISFTARTGQLLAGSDDPRTASGRVVVEERDNGMRFSVWQTHAWHDHGALIDAAYLCTHG